MNYDPNYQAPPPFYTDQFDLPLVDVPPTQSGEGFWPAIASGEAPAPGFAPAASEDIFPTGEMNAPINGNFQQHDSGTPSQSSEPSQDASFIQDAQSSTPMTSPEFFLSDSSTQPQAQDGQQPDAMAAFRTPMTGGMARLRVIGVGGAGTNSVTSMLKLGLKGVDFLVANTDRQALEAAPCSLKLQLGPEITRGLGAGSNPEVGRAAAEASRADIESFLRDADMVFIACGMGGGTGTGAAPVVARIAREMGVLSVGVCTRPFKFEGPRRQEQAERGLAELSRHADTMIVVSNQKLLEAVGPAVAMRDAFEMANTVLAQGVGAISELVSVPGLINVDFADIRTILSGSGDAVMGIGRAKGEQRAVAAVNKACSSPLLEKIVVEGARGILICIQGGPDITLHEVNEAAMIVNAAASPDANIIFGAVVDESMRDELKVTVLATGFAPRRAEAPQSGTASPQHSQAAPALPEVDPLSILDEMHTGNGNGHHEAEHTADAASLASRMNLGSLGDEDGADVPAYKRLRRNRLKGRFF